MFTFVMCVFCVYVYMCVCVYVQGVVCDVYSILLEKKYNFLFHSLHVLRLPLLSILLFSFIDQVSVQAHHSCKEEGMLMGVQLSMCAFTHTCECYMCTCTYLPLHQFNISAYTSVWCMMVYANRSRLKEEVRLRRLKQVILHLIVQQKARYVLCQFCVQCNYVVHVCMYVCKYFSIESAYYVVRVFCVTGCCIYILPSWEKSTAFFLFTYYMFHFCLGAVSLSTLFHRSNLCPSTPVLRKKKVC